MHTQGIWQTWPQFKVGSITVQRITYLNGLIPYYLFVVSCVLCLFSLWPIRGRGGGGGGGGAGKEGNLPRIGGSHACKLTILFAYVLPQVLRSWICAMPTVILMYPVVHLYDLIFYFNWVVHLVAYPLVSRTGTIMSCTMLSDKNKDFWKTQNLALDPVLFCPYFHITVLDLWSYLW